MPVSHKTHTDPIRKPTDYGGEDPLRELSAYDIVIVLDDSYSMVTADNTEKKSRWNQAWEALEKLVAEGSKYVTNGIDIHFLNKQRCDTTVKGVDDLKKLRHGAGEPVKGAHTPTGDVLDRLLCEYKKKTGKKPGLSIVKKRVFLVITDGSPTDSPDEPIIDAAEFYQRNGFPRNQVGIQFLQVGNDRKATEYLEWLDTGLPDLMNEDRRDMVDTVKSNGTNLNGDLLVKALIGSINRKQDRAGETRSTV
jgi:hypothetical protein